MNKTLNSIALNTTAIDSSAPDMVLLIPAGQVVGRDGRTWQNNDPASIMLNFEKLGRDLPIDIEHASELKAPNGDPAPAVGWVKMLQLKSGEVWGQVEWTETGRNMVESKAYRYLSPVIIYHKESRSIAGLTSVGLTNRPNLYLPGLNHEQPQEDHMWKALLAALSLPETATEAEAVAKVASIKAELATAANHAQNPSLEKFVPRTDYDAMQSRAANAEEQLKNVEKEKLDSAINTEIEKALQAGKITPASVEYHKAQCQQEGGLARFQKYCEVAPVIGDPSGLDKKKPDGTGTALNVEEQKVADMFGNTAEDLAKYGK